MGASPTTMAPVLLRNLVTSMFFFADKSLVALQHYRVIELIRRLLITSFLFFLRLLPSVLPSVKPNFSDSRTHPFPSHKPPNAEHSPQISYGAGDSGIARALSQLLAIVNNLPVSSRKYEAVRSLAERIIDENRQEGSMALREVNRTVLSAAFARTLNQLEAAMKEQERERGGGYGVSGTEDYYNLNSVVRAVRSFGDVAWGRPRKSREDLAREGSSAEKLAAELVWLAEKLAACGCTEEAVSRWASASNLAWLAISAEPRLEGCLVKVSAFLFKQAKDVGLGEADATKKEEQRQIKIKMLTSWLPLLCRASNGTDTPILSLAERAELERVLEEIIGMLEQEGEQERVLSQWLHHFMYCPSSDWPNLHASYTRWCTTSRRLLASR